MPETLVLRFSETPTDPVEWLIVDQAGGQVGAIERGNLQACAEAAAGRRVIALVPGTNVLRTDVDLPIRNQSKLLQALPFAMEDQLAGDIDELHFAVGKRTAERIPVAVVERLKMEAWLEQISAVGLDLVGVYTDGDVLGDMPNTTILLVEEQRVILRDTNGQVTAADLESCEALLDLWFIKHKTTGEGDDLPAPVNLLIYLSTQAADAVQPVIDKLRLRVESLDVVSLPDSSLPRLAAQSITAPGINLLQGAYAPRSKLGAYWPAWRVAAALLIGLCILLPGAKILEIAQLNEQAAGLDQAIEQAIRYTFPEVREVRDARALLDSKLRALGNRGTGDTGADFLSTLGLVAGAVGTLDDKKITIETISYRSGSMELRILAPNVDTLDRIRETIAGQTGMEAEIQSANPDREGVLGRLQIRTSGA